MPTQVQSVLFRKGLYSITEMKAWLKKFKLKTTKHHETTNFVRWRQTKPIEGSAYRMHRAGKGIFLVLMST